MRIAEIFQSVQGEGLLTGQDSVFVRASGCNLRCWFCDTPYTSWQPEGDELDVDDVLTVVETFDAAHVVITGGEPMLYADMTELTRRLAGDGRHITIETAGTVHQSVRCDLMSISPKLAGSTPAGVEHARWRELHEARRHRPGVIRQLIAESPYQFKFVVDAPADIDEVERYLDEFPEIDRARVMLMPQGIDAAQLAEKAVWLAPECQRRGLLFCPRRHIEWYGLVRGR